ncbi:MAG: hypothetical protein MJ120_00030 [Clostridia bacterium]|nr:hypothetical protein [Clostridia bacterium]
MAKFERFHIRITDNETGDVLIDRDARAILGCATDEERTTTLDYFNGDILHWVTALCTVNSAIKDAINALPENLQQIAKCNMDELPKILETLTKQKEGS